MYNAFECSIQFIVPLTALLESVDLFHGIKLQSLKYPPNNNFMLTLCWSRNSQPIMLLLRCG